MQEAQFTVKFLEQEIPCFYLTTIENSLEAIDILMQCEGVLGIDTETCPYPEYAHIEKAGLQPHLSSIRLLQVYDGITSYIFDLRFIKDTSIFLRLLVNKQFVAHHALFDLQFFMLLGAQNMNIGCTLLMSKLLFHASYPTDTHSASLGDMIKAVFKEDVAKKLQLSDWSQEDLTFEQVQYAALDAVLVLRLAERLAPAIQRLGLGRSYQLLKASQHPIAAMQLKGMMIDKESHRAMVMQWRNQLVAAKREVLELTGIDAVTGHKIGAWLEANLDPETLAMWPRTEPESGAKGVLSTDSNTFAEFSYLPIVAPIARFKKREKLTSTFGLNLHQQLNPVTGRLHCSFNLTGARTGRLSCSRPNLQQAPRSPSKEAKAAGEGDLRSIFIVPEGYVLVAADYSQVELRVAAELSQDEEMLSAYRNGIDLHALTASKTAHKPLKDVTKQERQLAKAVNFGLLFGLGAAKFASYAKKSYGVEVSDEEAHEAVDIFRDTYRGYREWQLNQVDRASTTYEVRTPCGKLRKLPEDNTYGTAMNTPVQGGAAEVMLHALVFLYQELIARNLDANIINCVHDEILVECNKAFVNEVVQLVNDCMVNGYLAVFPNGIINSLVEVKYGRNWSEAK